MTGKPEDKMKIKASWYHGKKNSLTLSSKKAALWQ